VESVQTSVRRLAEVKALSIAPGGVARGGGNFHRVARSLAQRSRCGDRFRIRTKRSTPSALALRRTRYSSLTATSSASGWSSLTRKGKSASGAARDASVFDQQGCLSPTVFLRSRIWDAHAESYAAQLAARWNPLPSRTFGSAELERNQCNPGVARWNRRSASPTALR
jgi:hypothetical protein